MAFDPFEIYTEASAPSASQPILAEVKKEFGMIPNLESVMAGAPALLKAYSEAWSRFDETSLTPVERQIVYQTANFENECDYCVPWHTLLSIKAGMLPEDVEALRTGTPLSTPRFNELRAFARTLIHNRGKVSQADLAAFFVAGFTPQHALEVVLGLAIKTMSNYTNSIVGTPLDRAVKKHAWRKPRISMRDPTPAS
jgi:alkylhydroperoxidase family enzyme